MKGILINETHDEFKISKLCYYDLLPPEVKKIVDKALVPIQNGYVGCDIYEEGLQYLFDYEINSQTDVFVKIGDTVEYMGEVTLCHIE